jgi:hypothetical protein
MLINPSFDSWLLLALMILVMALLLYIVWLRLELWASRRVIAALEVADVREPRQQRRGKSIVPALLAWTLLLLTLGQALGDLFN